MHQHFTKFCHFLAVFVCTLCLSLPSFAAPLLNAINLTSYIRGESGGSAVIHGHLEKYYGQEITARLLQQILDEIDRTYREIGYTSVKAYIPEQVSRDGTVNIAVAAPMLQSVRVDNRSGVNIQTRKKLFSDFEEYEGYAVNAGILQGRLLSLADLGVFDVDAGFSRGSYDDTVRLDVRLDKKQRYPFTLFADNHGTEASGIWRFGASGQVRNLTHYADILSLAAARSSESQNDGAVSYAIPVSSHPTVVGAGINFGSYELGDEYSFLGAKGYAVSGDLFLEEPWLRGGDYGVKSRFNLRYKSMEDRFETFDLRFKKSSTAFSGDIGAWYRNGSLLIEGSLRATFGNVKNRGEYAISPEGAFQVYNLEGAVSYSLSEGFTLKGRTEVQLSSRNLESSLRFQAGGASRVPAFKSSEVCGDEGVFVQGALEFAPSEHVMLAPHLDMAHVANHRGDSLSIKGMGLKGSLKYGGFFVSADVSKSLGSVKSEDSSQFLISFGYGRA